MRQWNILELYQKLWISQHVFIFTPFLPKIKNEFTEILTKPKLLSIPTTSPSTFIPVITETSFLKPKIDSLHIPTTNLVEYYDQMFPTLDTYQNFVDQKLHLWHSNLELKYFDLMYRHQRATTESIKGLRTQAQKLLEEADSLQEQKTTLRQEVIEHLSNISKPELWQQLYNPTKVYPQPPFPHVREVLPGPSCPSSCTVHFAHPNHSFQPHIFCCFQCDSPHHLKWNCPNYWCRLCEGIAPGHSQKNCPQNRPQHFDDGERGYFDIGGEEDGNMQGECWILKDK